MRNQFLVPHIDYNESFDVIKNISGLTLALDYRHGVFTDTALTTPATIGQGVGGWRNWATDAYHATQGTAANKPLLTDGGLAFDGSNDYLAVARMTGQFGAGFSYFVVASLADGQPPAVKGIFNGINTVGLKRYLGIVNETSGNLNLLVSQAVNVTTTIATLENGQSAMFLASATANPSGNLTGYFNGAQSGTPAALTGLTWSSIADGVSETPYIGASNVDGVPTTFTACKFKTVLIWNRPLTATELLITHRYIGNTHGIIVP